MEVGGGRVILECTASTVVQPQARAGRKGHAFGLGRIKKLFLVIEASDILKYIGVVVACCAVLVPRYSGGRLYFA